MGDGNRPYPCYWKHLSRYLRNNNKITKYKRVICLPLIRYFKKKRKKKTLSFVVHWSIWFRLSFSPYSALNLLTTCALSLYFNSAYQRTTMTFFSNEIALHIADRGACVTKSGVALSPAVQAYPVQCRPAHRWRCAVWLFQFFCALHG